MRTRLIGWILAAGLGASPLPAAAQITDSAAVAGAQRFIALLQAGEWTRAEERVAPPLRDRLGAAQLETVWAQISAALGAGTVQRLRDVSRLDTMLSVELYGDFVRDTVLFRVVLAPNGAVMGFWVGAVPDAAPARAAGPPYAEESTFREPEVRVGAEPATSRRRSSRPSRSGCAAGRSPEP